VGFAVLFPKQVQRSSAAGMEWLLPNALPRLERRHRRVRRPPRLHVRKSGCRCATAFNLPPMCIFPAAPVPSRPSPSLTLQQGRWPVDCGFLRSRTATRWRRYRTPRTLRLGGRVLPVRAEVDDGVDFTRWLKRQSWCQRQDRRVRRFLPWFHAMGHGRRQS